MATSETPDVESEAPTDDQRARTVPAEGQAYAPDMLALQADGATVADALALWAELSNPWDVLREADRFGGAEPPAEEDA